MASIEQLKASDGSGNANVATVQSSRSSGASTIIVDTVTGINVTGFSGSMGTPHTFTDPITSETITVISEATAVDFTGHVDGSNLEIDDIAPGYVDNGSEVGDIIIIRPTTQWSDNLAETLEVAHNDDGTLKNDAVTTNVIDDDAVTAPKVVGIDKSNLTTDSNPYKFRVRRAAAFNSASGGAPTKIAFDTEDFDTNNNFTGGTYTAPVAGFYHFNAFYLMTNPNAYISIRLYKNGALYQMGQQNFISNADVGVTFSDTIQAAASDTFEIYVVTGTAGASSTTTGFQPTFSGFLVSRT